MLLLLLLLLLFGFAVVNVGVVYAIVVADAGVLLLP